eukprot:TRINITY_DN2454_c0_g1_i3.p1 TRINITY_DN2454_c0_g1~~TRINITY_DN2454_c0_g1_i3.p1  ORF type:complete len:185 (+),score=13.09 TRINITY_DN2454_c0_g1_i3:134-688(+)
MFAGLSALGSARAARVRLYHGLEFSDTSHFDGHLFFSCHSMGTATLQAIGVHRGCARYVRGDPIYAWSLEFAWLIFAHLDAWTPPTTGKLSIVLYFFLWSLTTSSKLPTTLQSARAFGVEPCCCKVRGNMDACLISWNVRGSEYAWRLLMLPDFVYVKDSLSLILATWTVTWFSVAIPWVSPFC